MRRLLLFSLFKAPSLSALGSVPAQGLSATEAAILSGLGPVGRPGRAAVDELSAEREGGGDEMTATTGPSCLLLLAPDYWDARR